MSSSSFKKNLPYFCITTLCLLQLLLLEGHIFSIVKNLSDQHKSLHFVFAVEKKKEVPKLGLEECYLCPSL